mmetsp:Transcript_13334/g.33527  ORF Transcript_13334/g.33527 Transcript_13334/m.33527 type:complete len:105 (-) Transcript_13334:509-823(-)
MCVQPGSVRDTNMPRVPKELGAEEPTAGTGTAEDPSEAEAPAAAAATAPMAEMPAVLGGRAPCLGWLEDEEKLGGAAAESSAEAAPLALAVTEPCTLQFFRCVA